MFRQHTRIHIAVAALIFALGGTLAKADDGAAKLAAARAYLAVVQTDEHLERMAAAAAKPMLDLIRTRQPQLFAEKGDRLGQLIAATYLSGLQEAMIGADTLMASQFSLEELQALGAFAQTPAGSSVLTKLPEFSVALQPRIQAALRTILPQLAKTLQAEGVTIGAN